MLAAMLKGAGVSYLRGAMAGFSLVNGPARANGIDIGDFRQLQTKMASNLAASVSVNDFKDLERQLREIAPNAVRRFRAQARKIGNPARDEVRRTFRSINLNGPLGAPKRPGRTYDKMATSEVGRLSWVNSKILSPSESIDVNYRNRNAAKDFRNLQLGADGTLSIVRVRVRAPAYIVADMAGKSMKAAKATGTLTRDYQINLFGRGVVTRRHAINGDNVENWLRALDSRASNRQQGKPSRYAWPTIEKHMPKFRNDASKLLNDTVAEINRRMQR